MTQRIKKIVLEVAKKVQAASVPPHHTSQLVRPSFPSRNYIAMAIGLSVFAGIIFILNAQLLHKEPFPSNINLINLLSKVLASIALISYSVATVLFRQTLSKIAETQAPINPQQIYSRIQAAYILRIAFYEAVALFGLVILMLSVLFHVIHLNKTYWALILPYIMFLALVLKTFPTKESLTNLFDEYSIRKI